MWIWKECNIWSFLWMWKPKTPAQIFACWFLIPPFSERCAAQKISLSYWVWCQVSSTCCWRASDFSGDSGDLWRQAGTASPQASAALMWLPVGKLTLGTQEKQFSELVQQTGRLCWGFWEWRAISCLHRKKSYWKQICTPVSACDLDLCANR